jgi:hypothetical protein
MTNDDSVSADKYFLHEQPRNFLLFGYVERIRPGVQFGEKSVSVSVRRR